MIRELFSFLRSQPRDSGERLAAAAAAASEGNSRAAMRHCEAVLRSEPSNIDAMQILASVCLKAGQPARAVDVLETAIRVAPARADLHSDLATALQAQGRHGQAAAAFRRSLEIAPGRLPVLLRLAQAHLSMGDPQAAHALLLPHALLPEARPLLSTALIKLDRSGEAIPLLARSFEEAPSAELAFNLGVAFNNAGSRDTAGRWMETALSIDPDSFDALHALGLLRLQENRLADAEALLRRAVERRHDDPMAHASLALAQHRLGRHEDAIDSCQLAVHFDPGSGAAWYHCGLAEHALGRYPAAVESYRRALAAGTASGDVFAALALTQYEQGEYREATGNYLKALENQPGDKKILNNMGLAYRESGHFEAAADAFKRSLEADPAYVIARSNLGLAMQDLGRTEEALACFRRALEEDPQFEEARWNASVVLLRAGNFERGWPEYENRWMSRVARKIPFRFAEWAEQPLAGRRLLVYAEQGLGDQIMFASCVPEVVDHAGEVILECSSKLEKLFRRSFPRATVFGSRTSDEVAPPWLGSLAPMDFQVAIGSLPRRYRSHLSSFPVHRGYLRADPGRVEHWRRRLAGLGPGPYVGISWQGGAVGTRRWLRSLPLASLGTLFRGLPARYVSLQYTQCEEEIASLRAGTGVIVEHWQEAIDDYDETAALVCALDLVVSVCTSVIHLAGALGRPTLVMVPFTAEWRYGSTGRAMPWYPSVRLLRQQAAGEWQPVIERVVLEARDALIESGIK